MIYFVTKEQRLFNDLNNITICNDYNKVLEYFEDKKYIGLDTETEGFDPFTKKVLLMQLGDRENQFVIDTRTISPLLFKDLLEDPTKVFILQNAKFDLRFLLHYRIVVQEVFDTYLAESVLFTGIKYARKALDFLVEKYLGKTLNKEIRSQIHKEGNTERVIKYAAEDVEFLEDLMNEQLKELNKKDLIKALDLDNKFVKVLAYCEYCGIYLNPAKWKAKMQKDLQRQEKSKQELNKYIIDNGFEKYIEAQLDLFSSERRCNINWASSKQVVPLMKSLGVNTQVRDPKTGNMKDSVEADVIKTQVDKSPLLARRLKVSPSHVTLIAQGKRRPSTKLQRRIDKLGFTNAFNCLTFNQGVGSSSLPRPTIQVLQLRWRLAGDGSRKSALHPPRSSNQPALLSTAHRMAVKALRRPSGLTGAIARSSWRADHRFAAVSAD